MIQWIVAGLGNPGRKYQNTRHNVGFMAVDELALGLEASGWKLVNKFDALTLENREILLIKPQTFMNESGKAVSAAMRFYKIPLNHLVVIHDDLDIPLGMVKMGFGRGPKVHNGIDSIETQLGSKDFWRIRIGTDNRSFEDRLRVTPTDYVLKQIEPGEMLILDKTLEVACVRVREIVKKL